MVDAASAVIDNDLLAAVENSHRIAGRIEIQMQVLPTSAVARIIIIGRGGLTDIGRPIAMGAAKPLRVPFDRTGERFGRREHRSKTKQGQQTPEVMTSHKATPRFSPHLDAGYRIKTRTA